MRCDGLILHYAEVATKGRNRPLFIGKLAENVQQALSGLPFGRVERLSGRLFVRAQQDDLDLATVHARLKTVYGLSSYSPVVRTALDLDRIKEQALALIQGRTYTTFRVSARRVFKDLPYPSLMVDREVGAYLLQHHPAKVKLEGADLQVYCEMMPGSAYLYVDKFAGALGLPAGISGKVMCLLSGGIDSPVAAARMQRRGCRVFATHFHSHPFLSRASQEKAVELAEHLAAYQGQITLFLVPFGELQREIVTNAPPALRVVLYRRFMIRIAATLAAQFRCRALVTGESLGQVASQTLSNLVAINAASPLPILRPLIGFDKQEIIAEAKKLGTYETSILPDEDCCTLFVPRDPETHARAEAVTKAETALDIERLCSDALTRHERRDLAAPWVTPRAPRHPGVPQGDTVSEPRAADPETPAEELIDEETDAPA
ncbi:MAG: tRNA 4-thiouridine(8) synthase ThiI [Deltaproteobacteria bacterium]|nr:tRNA 4-thiouridine(8) synthase ThiI [Deltaproteobacteria bacterium]